MDILFSFSGNKEDPLTTKELIIYIVIITLIVAFVVLIWYFTIGKKRMNERKERLTETPTPAEQKCIDQNMKCIIGAPKDVNGNTTPDAQQKCDTENINCIMNLPFSM